MKYLLIAFLLSGCASSQYLVNKGDCEEVGPQHFVCKKVFKVK